MRNVIFPISSTSFHIITLPVIHYYIADLEGNFEIAISMIWTLEQ